MPYTGRLYVAELNDRQVRTRWFKTWVHMQREYTSRDKDRQQVETLTRKIAREGQRKPVHLGVNYRGEEVTLDDGNHRILALRELRIETVLFQWYDTSRSTRMLDEPFDYGRFGLANPDA